jgi:hypothetical protein
MIRLDAGLGKRTNFMATPKEREHMKELVGRADGRIMLKCVLKNSVNLQAELFL